jgi:hypothetical protein
MTHTRDLLGPQNVGTRLNNPPRLQFPVIYSSARATPGVTFATKRSMLVPSRRGHAQPACVLVADAQVSLQIDEHRVLIDDAVFKLII